MKTTINSKKTDRDIIRYFEKAGLDYGAWSKAFNMHFGYYKSGINPFRLESMLQEMNEQVRIRLQLAKESTILDLGCGVGTTARYIAQKEPSAQLFGLTITPWQVEFGTALTRKAQLEKRVQHLEGHYENTAFPDNFADAAYAVESACYAQGADKGVFIEELYRVLKPGGRFVITDGFRKHSRPLPRLLNRIYRTNMDCWALRDLADINLVISKLEAVGFKNIQIEDASWRVAPSFAHIPFVTARFFWSRWKNRATAPLHQERKNNVLAPWMGMLMGLARRHFSYYIITGEK